MKRKDVNEIAFETLQQAIGLMPKGRADRKVEAAELGRKGGLKGGAARANSLSKDKRAEIAKKAAAARWGKKSS
jgi:hypothetical protein